MAQAALWFLPPASSPPASLSGDVLARSAAERYVAELLPNCDLIAAFFRDDGSLDGQSQDRGQHSHQPRHQQQLQQQQTQQQQQQQQPQVQPKPQPQQPHQARPQLKRPHSFHQQPPQLEQQRQQHQQQHPQQQPQQQRQQQQQQLLQQEQQHPEEFYPFQDSSLPRSDVHVDEEYARSTLRTLPNAPANPSSLVQLTQAQDGHPHRMGMDSRRSCSNSAWESSFFPPSFPTRQPTRQRVRPTPGMAQTLSCQPCQGHELGSECFNDPNSSPGPDDHRGSTALVPLRPPASSSASSGTIVSKKAFVGPTISLGATSTTEPPSPSMPSARSRLASKPWLHNAKLPNSSRGASKSSERERFLPAPLTPNPFLDALVKLSDPDRDGGQEDGSESGLGRGGKGRRSLKTKGIAKPKNLQKAKTEGLQHGAVTSLGSTPPRPALFESMTKTRSRARGSLTEGSSGRPQSPTLGSSGNSPKSPRHRQALRPSQAGERRLQDYLQKNHADRLRKSSPLLPDASILAQGDPSGQPPDNDEDDESNDRGDSIWGSQGDTPPQTQAPPPPSPPEPTAPSPDSVFSIPKPPARPGKGGFHRNFGVKVAQVSNERPVEDEKHIDSRLARRVQGRFRRAQAQQDGDKEAEFTANNWEIVRMSRKLGLHLADVMVMKEIFDSFDADGSGHLELHEFEAVVTKILEYQLKDTDLAAERAKCASQWRWWDGDVDDAGSLTFAQFVKWYTSNGFKEDLLLSPEEQWLRSLAKKYSLSTTYVDQIKRCFDTYDADKSGEVDIDEFEQILNKVLRIPAGMRLPRSRIMYFWTEIDCDQSGTAPFEEFLLWWMRHFPVQGDRNDSLHAVTEFYRNVRRIGPAYVDPPTYQGWKDAIIPPSTDVSPMPSDRPRSKTVEIASENREMVYQSGSSGGSEGYSEGYYDDEYYDEDYQDSLYDLDFDAESALDEDDGIRTPAPGIHVREVFLRTRASN